MFRFGCGWLLSIVLATALFNDVFAEGRRFTAIRKGPNLKRSDVTLVPNLYEQTLMYADESLATATLQLEPTLPLLLIEDVDEYFKSITCTESTLVFNFHDQNTFQSAISAWSSMKNFAVIMSHDCSQWSDEHTARIISRIDIDYPSSTISLFGNQSDLRDVTRSINVAFDKRTDASPGKDMIFARQEQATSTNIATASDPATTTYTYSSPTAIATGNSVSGDVSFQRLNTTLLPPDSSIFQYLPDADKLQDIVLKCQNCTMTGNIELTAGGFSINSSDSAIVMDFLENGFLEFDARGISAYMDFELEFLPGFSVLSFDARLPSIPLGAIEIAGILKFGPVLDLVFPAEVALGTPVTFQTGFAITAPPLAKIYLNMSHPDASYSSGFNQSKLHALPFTANVSDLSMNLNIGFKPQLVLGAGAGSSAINASVNGGIGVYLDLPSVTTAVSVLNNVSDTCDPASTHVQNGLINIVPSVTIDGGAQWDLDVTILEIDYTHDGSQNWLSNTTALPTQCLAWDAKASRLVDAASLKSTGSSSGSSSAQSGTNAASAKNSGQRKALNSQALMAIWFMMAAFLIAI